MPSCSSLRKPPLKPCVCVERGALRLEPAEPGLELAHVRAAPAVLALVQLPLALREKLLARRDRVGVVGELAARSEERLLGRAQLVETGLDLRKAGRVGIARDPLPLLDRALPRLELVRAVPRAAARGRRAPPRARPARSRRSPSVTGAVRGPGRERRLPGCDHTLALCERRGAVGEAVGVRVDARRAAARRAPVRRATRAIAARSSSSRSFTAATRSASWRFSLSSAARCSASAWRSCATGSSLSARRTSTCTWYGEPAAFPAGTPISGSPCR